jgi:error-prone DNA polymerase
LRGRAASCARGAARRPIRPSASASASPRWIRRADLLFERFISPERREPPDIDVDFEHERREEVIQYIYEKYGRERAGLAATVITYRARSAVREVGKASGCREDVAARMAGTIWGWSSKGIDERMLREAGLDPADPRLSAGWCALSADHRLSAPSLPACRRLRHHPRPARRGGADQNAAMEGRTVIEWDKDDLDSLGILKIDILALGMLTCIRKASICCASTMEETLTLAPFPPRTRRSTTCCAGPIRSACSRSKAGRR